MVSEYRGRARCKYQRSAETGGGGICESNGSSSFVFSMCVRRLDRKPRSDADVFPVGRVFARDLAYARRYERKTPACFPLVRWKPTTTTRKKRVLGAETHRAVLLPRPRVSPPSISRTSRNLSLFVFALTSLTRRSTRFTAGRGGGRRTSRSQTPERRCITPRARAQQAQLIAGNYLTNAP